MIMKEKKIEVDVQPPTPQDGAFQVGDLAVYPAHGVGRIEAIENRVINGQNHDFYILKVLENGMVIMIPTRNVEFVGLRDVISETEIIEQTSCAYSKNYRGCGCEDPAVKPFCHPECSLKKRVLPTHPPRSRYRHSSTTPVRPDSDRYREESYGTK